MCVAFFSRQRCFRQSKNFFKQSSVNFFFLIPMENDKTKGNFIIALEVTHNGIFSHSNNKRRNENTRET